MNDCMNSNSVGSQKFRFCLENQIKLIYSATSAVIGNNGKDRNHLHMLSQQKTKMLNNLKKWFNFKFEIIYFYNVYGPRQIDLVVWLPLLGYLKNNLKINNHLL